MWVSAPNLCASHFTPYEIIPGSHQIQEWVGSRASTDISEKRKISCSGWNLNLDRLAHSLVIKPTELSWLPHNIITVNNDYLLKPINHLFCVMEIHCIFCEVKTGFYILFRTTGIKCLMHGPPTLLWQRATFIIVGRSAGHMWKNNNKQST
jgi:hypothetical protein